jgi:hypothetical protein
MRQKGFGCDFCEGCVFDDANASCLKNAVVAESGIVSWFWVWVCDFADMLVVLALCPMPDTELIMSWVATVLGDYSRIDVVVGRVVVQSKKNWL